MFAHTSLDDMVQSGGSLSYSAFKIIFVRASIIQHSDDTIAKAAYISSMPSFIVTGSSTSDFEVRLFS